MSFIANGQWTCSLGRTWRDVTPWPMDPKRGKVAAYCLDGYHPGLVEHAGDAWQMIEKISAELNCITKAEFIR